MGRKAKVLFFLPGGAGGAERMTVTVAKLLPRDRYCVKFVVLGNLKNIYDFIPKDYQCDCIPLHNIYCFATLRIYLKIIQEKPDLVYTSQAAYNPRVIIASRMAGVKVIARSSGMVGTYKKIFRLVKATYKHATLLIAQQEAMRQEMSSLLNINLSKIVTLHNPLDVENIDAKVLAENPFPKDQINFVNVSRISIDKGHDIAIQAFLQVKNEIPKAHIYFVGHYNKEDKYYKSLVDFVNRNHLEDCVHFVGFDSNPYKWMKYADCFVFPSRREGLPNALIEAQYIGIPSVAATCLEIINEIIVDGENGYKVPVGDSEELSIAMKKCLNIKKIKMTYVPSSKESYIKVFDDLLKSQCDKS